MVRRQRETAHLEQSETDCSWSAASGHECPTQKCTTSGPSPPQIGRPLTWWGVHARQVESPSKRQEPFWGGLSAVQRDLRPHARCLCLDGHLVGCPWLASEHAPSGRPAGEHPKAAPRPSQRCSLNTPLIWFLKQDTHQHGEVNLMFVFKLK